MTEPDRIIIFRVCWLDDDNHIRTNRAYRVQFNNAIGPYAVVGLIGEGGIGKVHRARDTKLDRVPVP